MRYPSPTRSDAVDVSFDRQPLPDAVCPGCGQRGLQQFYCVSSLPVHSCLLLNSRRSVASPARGVASGIL